MPDFLEVTEIDDPEAGGGGSTVKPAKPLKVKPIVDEDGLVRKAASYARKYGVPEDLYVSLVKQESQFNPDAKSLTGVIGLSQMTLATGKAYGIRNNQDRYDPDKSLDAGAAHFRDLLKEHGNNYRKALMAYNGGSDPHYDRNVARHLSWARQKLQGLGPEPEQQFLEVTEIDDPGEQYERQGTYDIAAPFETDVEGLTQGWQKVKKGIDVATEQAGKGLGAVVEGAAAVHGEPLTEEEIAQAEKVGDRFAKGAVRGATLGLYQPEPQAPTQGPLTGITEKGRKIQQKRQGLITSLTKSKEELGGLTNILNESQGALTNIENQIVQLKQKIEANPYSQELIDQHNALVRQYNEIRQQHNQRVKSYNKLLKKHNLSVKDFQNLPYHEGQYTIPPEYDEGLQIAEQAGEFAGMAAPIVGIGGVTRATIGEVGGYVFDEATKRLVPQILTRFSGRVGASGLTGFGFGAAREAGTAVGTGRINNQTWKQMLKSGAEDAALFMGLHAGVEGLVAGVNYLKWLRSPYRPGTKANARMKERLAAEEAAGKAEINMNPQSFEEAFETVERLRLADRTNEIRKLAKNPFIRQAATAQDMLGKFGDMSPKEVEAWFKEQQAKGFGGPEIRPPEESPEAGPTAPPGPEPTPQPEAPGATPQIKPENDFQVFLGETGPAENPAALAEDFLAAKGMDWVVSPEGIEAIARDNKQAKEFQGDLAKVYFRLHPEQIGKVRPEDVHRNLTPDDLQQMEQIPLGQELAERLTLATGDRLAEAQKGLAEQEAAAQEKAALEAEKAAQKEAERQAKEVEKAAKEEAKKPKPTLKPIYRTGPTPAAGEAQPIKPQADLPGAGTVTEPSEAAAAPATHEELAEYQALTEKGRKERTPEENSRVEELSPKVERLGLSTQELMGEDLKEPQPTPAAKEPFKVGDKVTWTGAKGEKLTGTVDSQPLQGEDTVAVYTDQIAKPGGVPLARVEQVPREKLQKATKEEAPEDLKPQTGKDLFDLQNSTVEHKIPIRDGNASYFDEAAGDVFRELTKDYPDPGYINEKLAKLNKFNQLNNADILQTEGQLPNVDRIKLRDYRKNLGKLIEATQATDHPTKGAMIQAVKLQESIADWMLHPRNPDLTNQVRKDIGVLVKAVKAGPVEAAPTPPTHKFKVGDVVMAKPGADVPAFMQGKRKIQAVSGIGNIQLEGSPKWFPPTSFSLTEKAMGEEVAAPEPKPTEAPAEAPIKFWKFDDKGKVELHFGSKEEYNKLPEELRGRIKRFFNWSRKRNAWVSKAGRTGARTRPLAMAKEAGLEEYNTKPLSQQIAEAKPPEHLEAFEEKPTAPTPEKPVVSVIESPDLTRPPEKEYALSEKQKLRVARAGVMWDDAPVSSRREWVRMVGGTQSIANLQWKNLTDEYQLKVSGQMPLGAEKPAPKEEAPAKPEKKLEMPKEPLEKGWHTIRKRDFLGEWETDQVDETEKLVIEDNEGNMAIEAVVEERPGLGYVLSTTMDNFQIPNPDTGDIFFKTEEDAKLAYHRRAVLQAAAQGKTIPTEVVAQYPELKQRRLEEAVQEARVQEQKDIQPVPIPHQHIASFVKGQLLSGENITEKDLFAKAAEAYGGTLADGAFTSREAYDAMELGVNQYIRDLHKIMNPSGDSPAVANKVLTEILDNLPTERLRGGKTETFQQFSTPPPLAFLANRLANVGPDDVYLEPSAGVGGLAVFGKNAGAREIIVNELDPKRAKLLESLPFDNYYMENAEQLNNILPDDVKPTVVVMNPPFSQTAGRMAGKKQIMTAAVHIEQALKRLEPGGRLVAITGRGMGLDADKFRDWWKDIMRDYDVKANVSFSGQGYKKYGTVFDNRILIIDRTGPTINPENIVTGRVENPALAFKEIPKLEEIRNGRAALSVKPRTHEPVSEEVPATGGRPRQQPEELPPATGSVGGRKPATGGAVRGPAPGLGPPGTSLAGQVGPPSPVPERGREGVEVLAPKPVQEPRISGPGDIGTSAGPADIGKEDAVDYIQDKEISQAQPQKKEFTDEIFEEYQAPITIKGAKKHPTPLVESSAMSAVEAPPTKYFPKLPQKIITSGALSRPQLLAVIQAGAAHNETFTHVAVSEEGDRQESQVRRGYFIGDGTGVGKGREIAAVIWDNWNRGRKKAVWVSASNDLFKDAQRDAKDIGFDPKKIFSVASVKSGSPLQATNGVAFLSYDTLKAQGKDKDNILNRRLDQLVSWLGKDFDGVIAFDECHKMGNLLEVRDNFGVKKPSQRAITGWELRKALPNARVLYVSATGATEITNLAYLDRLGLWGQGRVFNSIDQFVNEISAGGIAGMEIVANHLKAEGSYQARQLAYRVPGNDKLTVTYERLEHQLTEKQTKTYDALSKAWQLVMHNMEEALQLTGNVKGRDRAAKMSQFWGAELRFYDQVLGSLQVPSIIAHMEKALEEGNTCLVQFYNTYEAQQNREIERMEKGQTLDDLDLTPRQNLIEYVKNGFPVQQYETYIDENGNTQIRAVEDSQGNSVLNKEAVAMRDALIQKLEILAVPESPIDQIINHFGPERVAEVTGRKRRVVLKYDEEAGTMKKKEEKRSGRMGLKETDEFLDGKRDIILFNDKGGTGRSFHADPATKSGIKRRYHYVLQPGWRADNALQGLGRSHRSGQDSAPHVVLCCTNLHGHKRFISTIARRLDQLGALTRGHRKAGSGALFNARDNLENTQANAAMRKFWEALARNRLSDRGIYLNDFQDMTGLKLVDPKTGSLKSQLPPIRQFLNRMLVLTTDVQNNVFDTFSEFLEQEIQQAIEAGTLDVGMETMRADSIQKAAEEVVWEDPKSGNQAKYIALDETNPTNRVIWDEAQRNFKAFFINKTSGKVWAAKPPKTITNARSGELYQVRNLVSPARTEQNVRVDTLDDKEKWEKVDSMAAQPLWVQQFDEAPKAITRRRHLISGAILSVWDKMRGTHPRIMRVKTDDGEVFLGRLIPDSKLDAVLKKMGANLKVEQLSPQETMAAVMEQNNVVRLTNGNELKVSKVAGEPRLEIDKIDFWDYEKLKKYGVFIEKIQHKYRYFVPLNRAEEVLESLFKDAKIAAIVPRGVKMTEYEASLAPEVDDEDMDAIKEFYAGYPIGPQITNLLRKLKKMGAAYFADLPDKDISLLTKYADLPYWRAQSSGHWDTYRVQEVREENRHMGIEQYMSEVEPAINWYAQAPPEMQEKWKEAIWHMDKINKHLPDKDLLQMGLDKDAINNIRLFKRIFDVIQDEDLENLMRELGQPAAEINKLRRQRGKRKFWWPRPRQGKYFVEAWEDTWNPDGTKGKRKMVWFELFDDIFATMTGKSARAQQRIKKLRKRFPDLPAENFRWGEMKYLPEDIFFNTNPIQEEAIIRAAVQRMELPEDVAYEQLTKEILKSVADVYKARGLARHWKKRKDVPGYDKRDPLGAALVYIRGYIGFKTKALASREFHKSLRKLDMRTREADYWRKYVADMLANQEKMDIIADKTRGLLFLYFLGGVARQVLLQPTQNYIAGVPMLQQVSKWSSVKITNVMRQAAQDRLRALAGKKKKFVSEEEDWMLDSFRKRGIIEDQLAREYEGQLASVFGKAGQKLANAAKFFIGNAEIFNRETTAITAHRIGKELGMDHVEAMKLAERVIKNAHFVYGKGNLPPWARGGEAAKIARAGYTFRSYNYNLYRLYWQMGKTSRGRRGIMKGLLAFLMLGGLASLPLYKDIEEWIQRRTGVNLSTEAKKKLGPFYEYLRYGMPAALGIDLSGSMGIETIRWEGQGLPEKIGNFTLDMIGAPGELVRIPYRVSQDVAKGDYYRALEDLVPSVFKAPLKAYRMATEGMTTRRGKPILDAEGKPIKLSLPQAIVKGLTFRTTKEAESRRQYEAQRTDMEINEERQRLIDSWRIAAQRHGPESNWAKKAFKNIRDFNLRLRRDKINWIPPITSKTLRERRPAKRKMILKRRHGGQSTPPIQAPRRGIINLKLIPIKP
jgi:hypothetical protein